MWRARQALVTLKKQFVLTPYIRTRIVDGLALDYSARTGMKTPSTLFALCIRSPGGDTDISRQPMLGSTSPNLLLTL